MTIDSTIDSAANAPGGAAVTPFREEGGRAVALLPDAEAMFLRTLRDLAQGPAGWHAAQQEIWAACTIAHVERVLGGFERVLACLATGSRRHLALLPAKGRGLSADELAVINLVAAAQAGAFPHLTALANWLVVPSERGRLMSAATRLAAGLAASGLVLRYRRAAMAGDFRISG